MTDPRRDEQEEEPLDPRLESMRQKMMKLLAGSVGVMILGVMAVLIVIVYKVSRDAPSSSAPAAMTAPSDAPLTERLTLPSGFNVQSASLDGHRITLLGANAAGQRQLLIYDATTGAQIGAIALQAGQ